MKYIPFIVMIFLSLSGMFLTFLYLRYSITAGNKAYYAKIEADKQNVLINTYAGNIIKWDLNNAIHSATDFARFDLDCQDVEIKIMVVDHNRIKQVGASGCNRRSIYYTNLYQSPQIWAKQPF
jgi:hypothetical protein